LYRYCSGSAERAEEKEKWSESGNVGKRALSNVGTGLKGVWEALPAF
jgi:hypothetical protein